MKLVQSFFNLLLVMGLIGYMYAIIRFRSELRRDKTKEGIYLSIFVSCMILAFINIVLLAIYG